MSGKQVVFVDTVGWIALVHQRDDLHKEVVQIYRNLGRVLETGEGSRLQPGDRVACN